ncbi:YceD family protein [Xanthovirga aplysinae]|uniref:YceD family protein n=1 Tax=Xanthovirga aplysinae TaxID=2529853 RepID=UPI0012BC49CE|nr:DUF177 domain-containing protein [Xanthovirga aplysinae]MTI33599.1 DUF177 domain-containing protein [Xanthovirga aplysinae]
MKAIHKFDINIFSLSNGKHEYTFEIDQAFFQLFEYSQVEKGNLKANIELDKSETLINVFFSINGTVELICDRSLEPFDYPIETENRIIFKYGQEAEEINEEMVIIPYGAQQLNVAQYLYELISVAIPMKKLHPDFEEEEFKDDEDLEVLVYTSEEPEEESSADKSLESNKEEEVDPRWKALQQIKNKK